MIKRDIETNITTYLENPPQKTLLILGSRQVGKTTAIRRCIKEHFSVCIELSFKDDPDLKAIFAGTPNAEELLVRLSMHVGRRLTDEKTIFFFDDLEEYPEAIDGLAALTKLLRGDYYCIIAGTPQSIDVEGIQKDYSQELELIRMYPLSFREFCRVNGVTDRVCEYLQTALDQCSEIDPYIHQKMMELFHKYLLVGGMPEAVAQFLQAEDYERIQSIHEKILTSMQKDIRILDPKDKHYMQKIFSLIPSELSQHNKRFIMKNLGENFKFSRQKASFRTLMSAGLIASAFCLREPILGQADQIEENLFKLYLPDVGLLTGFYPQDVRDKLMAGQAFTNGALCENAIAQELTCMGQDLCYYSSHQYGEIDFLISYRGEATPMLIKAGKNYQRHNGIFSLMHSSEYAFQHGVVLGDDNISRHDKEIRLPIYMIGFMDL